MRLIILAILLLPGLASAESLFRANAQYNDNQPMPRSLFFQPAPRFVGDLLTVTLDESTTNNITSTLTLSHSSSLTDTSTELTNKAVKSVLQKIPLVSQSFTGKIANFLRMPSFNGLNDKQAVQSQAKTQKQSDFKDSITCQVLQVLPNGYLQIQGQKTINMNKEESLLYVSGIVNPYFLDRTNSISSKQVGNFSMQNGGQGIISRQQSDGLASKIYHVLH